MKNKTENNKPDGKDNSAGVSKVPVGKNSSVIGRKNFWICLFATSALWQVAFEPVGLWPLGFVLLSGFAVAAWLTPVSKRSFFGFWFAGMLCWMAAIYWLSWGTPPGWLGLAFYMGFYWPVAAVLLQKCKKRRLPLTLALPVVWVSLELVRGWLFSGFPWFFVSHTMAWQSSFIQLADITGSFGPSFLILMVNGLVAEFIVYRWFTPEAEKSPKVKRWLKITVGMSALLIVANLGYGSYRISQRAEHISPGPRIAAVQSAFSVSLFTNRREKDTEIFEGLLKNSPVSSDSQIDLLIWPESVLPYMFLKPYPSMIPGGGNVSWNEIDPETIIPEMKGFVSDRIRMQKQLAELLASQKDSPLMLMAGGITGGQSADGGQVEYTSALYLSAAGGENPQLKSGPVYSKIHCVPFSEYLPFKESFPPIYKFLRLFVPEEMAPMERGSKVLNVELPSANGQTYRIAQSICYEGVIARMCRRLIWQGVLDWQLSSDIGSEKADLLVNISNDGWFVWPFSNPEWPSSELDQHMAVYSFRAIENRVPIVRSVNTGISGHIDSAGRLVDVIDVGGSARMVKGSIVCDTEIDDRKTFYGRYGDCFAISVMIVLVLVLWGGKLMPSCKCGCS